MRVLTHYKQQLCAFGVPWSAGFHGRPISKRWFLKIVQVTMKHDPFDAHVEIHVEVTSILHPHTRLVPRA